MDDGEQFIAQSIEDLSDVVFIRQESASSVNLQIDWCPYELYLLYVT